MAMWRYNAIRSQYPSASTEPRGVRSALRSSTLAHLPTHRVTACCLLRAAMKIKTLLFCTALALADAKKDKKLKKEELPSEAVLIEGGQYEIG